MRADKIVKRRNAWNTRPAKGRTPHQRAPKGDRFSALLDEVRRQKALGKGGE